MDTWKVERLLEAIQEQLLAKVGECSCNECPAFEIISNAIDNLKEDSHYRIVTDLGLVSNRRCPLKDE